MNSRRDFLKQAAALGAAGVLPASIRRALAIDPVPGTTWRDAEHVVILMQENRSFDHCFGTLRGVRGFGDPRAVTLPDGLPVWLQTDRAGKTWAPFPLEMTASKSTWMESLPHSWADQIEARREGHHDRWLPAKPSGNKDYADLPLTLGYYTRADLPFYHALADAFTVCDQNFCSSLTGTTPNRLFLWTGTVRPDGDPARPAHLRNGDVDPGHEASWTTFPERLEAQGITWRVYQNELNLPTGLSGEEEAWLSNFSDNPLEWFSQYHVECLPAHHAWLSGRVTMLGQALKARPDHPEREKMERNLEAARRAAVRSSAEAFAALPAREQQLHRRAFTTNTGDPDQRRLVALTLEENRPDRQMKVPAGDVLHQFRADVRKGELPAVSWLVAPQHFSDHPTSPWYGAWYLAEAFDILTKSPDIWRKTIFILCYDENDGWFDHVPPFTAPDPERPETGETSPGLNDGAEYVSAAQEAEWKSRNPKGAVAEGPVGLGYRVPLVVASPWSRGGAVCSEVFDHTSLLRFLEVWLGGKTGKPVRESSISAWRRAVCGDLTSVFQPWDGEPLPLPEPVVRAQWLREIYEAQFRKVPGVTPLTGEERTSSLTDPRSFSGLPRQEPGVRPSRPLPYELSVTAERSAGGNRMSLRFAAGRKRFGDRSAGAAFHVYAPPVRKPPGTLAEIRPRCYTAAAGREVTGTWELADFPDGRFRLEAHGPNGFMRAWRISPGEPFPGILLTEGAPDGARHQLTLKVSAGKQAKPLNLRVEDAAYGQPMRRVMLRVSGNGEASSTMVWDCGPSRGWYHLLLTLDDFPEWEHRLAGRIEDGLPGWSDPAFGG